MPGRARTVANRAGTALTGAVRTGRQPASSAAARPEHLCTCHMLIQGFSSPAATSAQLERRCVDNHPGYMRRKFRKFRTDKFDTRNKQKLLLMQQTFLTEFLTEQSFDSCKRLAPSRFIHELHDSKFPFASRIEFI